MKRANDAGCNESGWVSVADRLPRPDVMVLCVKEFVGGRREICLGSLREDSETGRPEWCCSGYSNHVVYWMQIPTIPDT